MTGFLCGCTTALVTPFEGEAIGYGAFEKMLEYQIENGVSAVVVLGTTGEPATMTEEEKRSLIAFAVQKAAGRVKVIVGCGSNCTLNAVRASVAAQELGADGILAVTPYYNKCTQKGLIAYYRDICSAVRLPVICYNVPSRTGVNLLPETMARLAEIPNMAGIKEASGNMAQALETARLVRGKCDLYSGEDALNFPILAAGGAGVISVVSNLAPAGVKALCDAVQAGDLEKARALNDRLLPLIGACFSEVNPIPVKAGMNLLGFRAGVPRSPLTELESDRLAALRREMAAFGLEVVQ